MRIFPAELQIGELEGFAPEKDIFGRKELGLSLTQLFRSVAEPTVLAVDAQWGAGKTAFLKMWAGELRKAGFSVVYFDAYQHDYSADAFTAIASHVVTLVREKKKERTSAGKQFFEKAKGAGKILLCSGIRLGVKVATLNAVDTDDLQDTVAAAAEELSGLTDTYVGELITKQKEEAETFSEFRDALSALPKLLSSIDEDDSQPLPLIFIIDELDRCRPVFALETLERIKHFFSVPNVHFVLGTHLRQLENSVVAAYGNGIDASMYLQKFIHVTMHLVDESSYDHDRIVPKYISHLRKTLDFDQTHADTLRYTSEAIARIAEERALSLRTVERIMTNLALALAFTPKSRFMPTPIIAGLCVMKVLAPTSYAKAKSGKLSYSEAAKALGFSRDLDNNPSIQDFDIRWWRYCTDEDISEELEQKMGSGMGFYFSGGRSDIVPFIANAVLDRLVQGAN